MVVTNTNKRVLDLINVKLVLLRDRTRPNAIAPLISPAK